MLPKTREVSDDDLRRALPPVAPRPPAGRPGPVRMGPQPFSREDDREVESLRLDPLARRAFVGHNELPLTAQAFDLLAYFVEHRGDAVSFEAIAADVWSYRYSAGDHHFLHTAVYRLRRVLHKAGVENFIEGIRGFGYRINAPPTRPIELVGETARAIVVFDPTDPNLRLTMVNDVAERMSGRSVEALTNLQHVAATLWSPEERIVINAAVRETLATGTAKTFGRQLLRADGTTLSVDIVLTRLGLPEGSSLLLAEVTTADA